MLGLEFRKSIRGRTLFYIISTVALTYVLGYILPVGIDKLRHLTLGEFYFSTYTVFTQFGFLIFGFVIVYFFNKDYSDKCILYHYFSGCHLTKYFYTKLLVLFSEFFIAIIVCNILASLLWGYSLFYFLTTTILFSLVVLQYLLVVSTISILFSNMLVSIGVTIFYWITSIILVAIGGIFKVSAIFDASNSLYKIIGKLFSHPMTIDLTDFFIIVPYMICLSVISFLIVCLSNRRWLLNGM